MYTNQCRKWMPSYCFIIRPHCFFPAFLISVRGNNSRVSPVKLANVRKLIWLWVRHIPLCYKLSPRFRGTCKRAEMHLHHWAHSRGNECAAAGCSSWASPLFNRRHTAVFPQETVTPTHWGPLPVSQPKTVKWCFSIDLPGFFFLSMARLNLNKKHKINTRSSWRILIY